jgi:hypothetical protein
MRRSLLRVSLVLALTAVPMVVAAQGTTPSGGPPTGGTSGGTPAGGQVPAGQGTGTEPSTPPTTTTPVPVPVLPGPIPPSESAPPPPTISSAPVRVLPTLTGTPPNAIFTLVPGLSLSEEYSDNFNLTKTDRESNFRTSISPGAKLLINGATLRGIVGYTLNAAHDSTGKDFEFFHSFLGQITWEATPFWRLTVADVFTKSDEPGEADRLGLRRQRETFTNNTLSATSDLKLGLVTTREYYRWEQFSSGSNDDTTTHTIGASAIVPLYVDNQLTFGYEYVKSHSAQTSDLTGNQFTAAFARKLSSLMTVGISGSYAFRNLTNVDGSDQKFQIWNAVLFDNYAAGPLTLSVGLGVSGVTSDTGQSKGPLFAPVASLTYTFARAVASLSVDRGFSETFLAGEDFGVVETLGATASLSYAFTPNTSGFVSAYYRKTDQADIGGGQVTASRNELVGFAASVAWRITDWARLSLAYTYTQRFDDNTNPGYTENRARLGIDFAF